MNQCPWPSDSELDEVRNAVAALSGRDVKKVKVIASPYRICPLGAHIDHQGGEVSAMTINKGILLGFVPSCDSEVLLLSEQFGEVRFRVDERQIPTHGNKSNGKLYLNNSSKLQQECSWGRYARGALYALQSRGNQITKGIIGLALGSEGLDSSGLSSSAAVGIACLLALETANGLTMSPEENIEYDRLIENEYLGLRNGILDQSAILLSTYGCLTYMNCKTKDYEIIHPPISLENEETETKKAYKILLAFSGLKQALTSNPGYNRRVAECQEAANILLHAAGREGIEPLLSNVEPEVYESHKCKLKPDLAKRAEHYFTENMRVVKGREAWASGNLEDFGKLISASGLSSIKNYECGCEPLIQLYEILLKAPGVYGARFSGAGFRGCCIAFVKAEDAPAASAFVEEEYRKLQSDLTSKLKPGNLVMVCDAGNSARVI